jgi:hypothetical protein
MMHRDVLSLIWALHVERNEALFLHLPNGVGQTYIDKGGRLTYYQVGKKYHDAQRA